MADLLYFNGINASGGYGLPPTTLDDFVDQITEIAEPPENLNELEARKRRDDRIRYDKALFSLAKLKWRELEKQTPRNEAEIFAAQDDIVDTIIRLNNPTVRVSLIKKATRLMEVVRPQIEARLEKLELAGDLSEALRLENALENYENRTAEVELANFDQLRDLIGELESHLDLNAITDPTERIQLEVELRVYDEQLKDVQAKIARLEQLKIDRPADAIRELEYPEVEDISYYEAEIEARRQEKPGQSLLEVINARIEEIKRILPSIQDFGAKEGIDVTNLAETGWGIIFAYDDPNTEAIKTALKPLLDRRQEQAGKYFKVYEGSRGRRPDEDHRKFLGRYNARPQDPADPEKVPYYLLLVGNPQQIPFEFQYQLDVQYAVGRIYFETLAEYTNYAQSVVKAETSETKLPRNVSFFGVSNLDDRATELSSEYLVSPLQEALVKDYKDWEIRAIMEDDATKANLEKLMGGSDTPALLFTASHGMEFDLDDARQLKNQGALLCSDWPGPEDWRDSIPENFYFSGDDLTDEHNLLGMIAFFFACFGAGTPKYDQFSGSDGSGPKTVTEEDFLAYLPRQMLNRPKGGALAVIGHIDRTWGTSFLGGRKTTSQIVVYQSAIERLLKGHPIGSAFEYFNQSYAALSSDLTVILNQINFGLKDYDEYELATMWSSNNDARGYVIIGDPAVRLNVAEVGKEAGRQEIVGEVIPEEGDLKSGAASSGGGARPTHESLPMPERLKGVIEVEEWQIAPLNVQKAMIQTMNYINEIDKEAEDLELRGIELPLFELKL